MVLRVPASPPLKSKASTYEVLVHGQGYKKKKKKKGLCSMCTRSPGPSNPGQFRVREQLPLTSQSTTSQMTSGGTAEPTPVGKRGTAGK